MKTLQLLALPLALFAACAAPGSGREVTSVATDVELTFAMPSEANVMQAGSAPTPFSADELRAGNPPGTWREYRIVQGENTFISRHEFAQAKDPKLVMLSSQLSSESGASRGSDDTKPVAWTTLQAHASFPASRTLLGRDRLVLDAGQFDCWTYAVDGDEGETRYFWFAVDLPGPPVLLEARKNGVSTLRMELTAFGEAVATETTLNLDVDSGATLDARDRFLALGRRNEWVSSESEGRGRVTGVEALFGMLAHVAQAKYGR